MNNNDLPKIQPVIIENMEYPLPKQPNRFFQLLSNAGDKIGDVGGALRNRLSDIILGREVEEPKTIITDGGIQSGINNGGRIGGVASFLGDVSKGTKENMANSFEPTNLLPNPKKGFGYRLGEALGTGARLLDNSLVRGALAYGLSKYNGDYNPLEQGLIAFGTNMQNKTNDRLYRNDLARNGIDTSNIRGFINNNTYGNLIRSQQIRDNAEWRKLQNETMQDMKNREFEYRKKQDAIENAQKWAQIENAKDKGNAKEEAKRKQSQSTLNMIDSALEVVKNNPKAFGFIKGITPADITNRADLEGAKARAMIDSLAAEYRKYLTGAQMTEKERKHYERFLPNPRDNAEIIARKLVGMQETISAREGLFEKKDTQSLNIDTNAIEAELKKRGVK